MQSAFAARYASDVFYVCKKHRCAVFPKSQQKQLAKRSGLNGVHAKESMISFCTLLTLTKKQFTSENMHKRGEHKCSYIEQLHDIKTLYK